jgi:hypothetical protein
MWGAFNSFTFSMEIRLRSIIVRLQPKSTRHCILIPFSIQFVTPRFHLSALGSQPPIVSQPWAFTYSSWLRIKQLIQRAPTTIGPSQKELRKSNIYRYTQHEENCYVGRLRFSNLNPQFCNSRPNTSEPWCLKPNVSEPNSPTKPSFTKDHKTLVAFVN